MAKATIKIYPYLILVAALFLGGLVNGAIVELSGSIIPPPPGADFTTEEGLKKSMQLMEKKHFIFPFLAHALGTLISGLIVVLFLKNSPKLHFYVFLVGAVFFLAGAYMVSILPSPLWFNAVDLIFAYFPMAILPYWFMKFKKSAQ